MFKKLIKAILNGCNLYPNRLNQGYQYVLHSKNNPR